MTIEEQIMKLQTYKMYEGEDTVYVERDDVLKALKQQSCEDYVSCERVKQLFLEWAKKQESNIKSLESISKFFAMLDALPPVTPKIQEWLSSFNTESATECFTAVQELREKIKTN